MYTPAHILEQIQANRARQEAVLDLSDERLQHIPPEVLELEHLEELRLRAYTKT